MAPLVSSGSIFLGLRRAKRNFPSVEARASFSASLSDTSKVITFTGEGFSPGPFRSICVPVANTRVFSKTVLVILPFPRLGFFNVAMISTRSPGLTNPGNRLPYMT